MRNIILKTLAGLFSVALMAGTASAEPFTGTYDASDASGACGGHGFWTNNFFDGCDNYFSVESVEVAMAADGTSGTIIGTAKNGSGLLMEIDLAFSEWMDGAPGGAAGYKQEGGGAYDADNQDFFALLTGTITLNEMTVFDISIHAYSVQLGLGANAKNLDFGLSSWIDAVENNCAAIGNDGPNCNLPHWDINLSLTTVDVPEPGTLALLGLGLLGLGAARRRKSA